MTPLLAPPVTDPGRNDLARPFERLDRIARRAKKRGQR